MTKDTNNENTQNEPQAEVVGPDTTESKPVVSIEVEEKQTVNALTMITKKIISHKKSVHNEFMDDAKDYLKRMKQAKEDAFAARSAA